jgi:hypothetical protein
MNKLSVFPNTLARRRSCQSRTWATERNPRVRPNPSIERTSTGLAPFAPQVYVSLRGPSRWWPAHVKR